MTTAVQSEVIFEDNFSDGNRDGWYTSTYNTTRSLSVESGRLTVSTGSNALSFLTYFTPTTINVGESITLSFNFTVSNAFTTEGLRYGLLNSFDSRLSADVGDSGPGSTFNGYQGVAGFQSMSTTEQRLRARSGGSDALWTVNPGGFNTQLLFQNANLGLTAGPTIYDGEFSIERTDATSLLITSTLNGVAISTTQTSATNFTFDTIGFNVGNGNVGFSIDDVSIVLVPEASHYALLTALPLLGTLLFLRRRR